MSTTLLRSLEISSSGLLLLGEGPVPMRDISTLAASSIPTTSTTSSAAGESSQEVTTGVQHLTSQDRPSQVCVQQYNNELPIKSPFCLWKK